MEIIETHPSIGKTMYNLSAALRAKVRRGIAVIGRFGEQIGFPDARKIEDKLYEFRITNGTHIRIFYSVHGNKAYILHIFIKKSQKIPQKELRLVRQRLRRLADI